MLAFERSQGRESFYHNLPKPLRIALTFAIVLIAWVFFRAPNLNRAVAYLASDTPAPGVPELRDFLLRSLPKYMVPSAFVALDAFPLTANGKVDRAALARVPLDDQRDKRELVPPRTDTEQRLAAIWKRLLALTEIGIHDDFFELGGHSLMAVRLTSEIERKLGVRLPLSALFETATIAGLAQLIDLERHEETVWPSLVRLREGNGQVPLFLIGWAGGEVLPYRDLVENLDSGVPVFGLRAPGVDRETPPLGTVEELAAYYKEEIRQVQPHGPYRRRPLPGAGRLRDGPPASGAGETTSTLRCSVLPAPAPRRRDARGRAGLSEPQNADGAGRRSG
jgi:acyl carrier protein